MQPPRQEEISEISFTQPLHRRGMAHDVGVQSIKAPQALRNFLADGENPARTLKRRGVKRMNETALLQIFPARLRKGRIEHVVEDAHGVHKIADVVAMPDHVGWSFCGYHAVVALEFEIIESKIGLLDPLEIALVVVDIEDFCFQSRLLQRRSHSSEEAFGPALLATGRERSNDRYAGIQARFRAKAP